jgi:glycosyltransferase involved in cell wall biosynthesis
VRFLGSRRPEELRSLYAGALALVMPSVCYETFGITLLEAFRDRTPVVARALGPLPEIVRESGGGILFEAPAELGEALGRLAGDEALRRKLADAGHHAFRERWIESAVLRQYFDLIRRVAERRGDHRVLETLEACA